MSSSVRFFKKDCGKKENMEKPLITFALMGYQQELFIRKAIEGAFSQTYEPLEIILSDDCSQDHTYGVMQEMAEAYKGSHKVILNRNERNLGIGGHLNQIAKLMGGKWIVTAAGDDISLPERVEESYRVISECGELGGVFGRFCNFRGDFFDNGDWEPAHASNMRIVRCAHSGRSDLLEIGDIFDIQGCVAMWNKKLFDQFGLLPIGVLAEDAVLGGRALFSGLGIGFTSSRMVLRRIHETNVCAGKKISVASRDIFYSRAVVHHELLDFRRRNPNLYSAEDWRRMVGVFETALFILIVAVRKDGLGWVRSVLVFMMGFKLGEPWSAVRFLKAMCRKFFIGQRSGK